MRLTGSYRKQHGGGGFASPDHPERAIVAGYTPLIVSSMLDSLKGRDHMKCVHRQKPNNREEWASIIKKVKVPKGLQD
jgi:hypothetical protein